MEFQQFFFLFFFSFFAFFGKQERFVRFIHVDAVFLTRATIYLIRFIFAEIKSLAASTNFPRTSKIVEERKQLVETRTRERERERNSTMASLKPTVLSPNLLTRQRNQLAIRMLIAGKRNALHVVG